METTPQAPSMSAKSYRVLARKYRPHNFSQLVGQDALVTTLTNAIKLGRVAQAFMLTGVRGVGKTSTARIIAKGLNCTTPSTDQHPRVEPCNECENCTNISAGKHIDVLEMDAASHTGVDDVREIIEGSAYRPVSSRYKIYIIDEVHMLSKNAFNALLKTLEEPPENVKFIFATTEIRKVPATILSRCQRFDLRRVKTEILADHLATISEAEQITAQHAALTLIAKAAEGSVRDALSMLDQAAAMGADTVAEDAVIDMLGQAGTSQILSLLEACLKGQPAEALSLYDTADFKGAEPEIVLADMLEIVHEASLAAAGARLEDMAESRLLGIKNLAEYGIAKLGRSWQLLLNGYDELRIAPDSRAAVKMILIRLAHIAPMPTPAEIIKKLPEAIQQAPTPASPPASSAQTSAQTSLAAAQSLASTPVENPAPVHHEMQAVQSAQTIQTGADIAPKLETLEDIVKLCEAKGEYILASNITSNLRLVSLSEGKLAVQLLDGQDDKFIAQLAKALSEWTEKQWLISLKNEGGGATLAEQAEQQHQLQIENAKQDPLVSAVLETFPSATVTAINTDDNDDVGAASPSAQH